MTRLHPSVRSRELGRQLLSAQQNAGFTAIALAAKLEWTPSMVSRLTTGHRPASDVQAARLLTVCGVVGAQRDEILRLCRPDPDTGLRLADNEHLSVYLAHARDAVRLVEFQSCIVPWMLQTPDYMRALIAESSVAPAERETHVTARRTLARLAELPRLDVLVHEWALRTPVRDAAVMSGQLHQLIQMSILPSVSVRVVPVGQGVHAGLRGPFTLLEFRQWPPVLYREDPVAVLLDDDPVITSYRSLVNHLTTIALDEPHSRELIGRIAVELYGQDNDYVDLTDSLAVAAASAGPAPDDPDNRRL